MLDLQGAKQAVEQLVALTLEFAEAYTQEKRKRNIVDFHDLEHLALKILVKREVSSDEKGNPTEYIVPTEAADQYAHTTYLSVRSAQHIVRPQIVLEPKFSATAKFHREPDLFAPEVWNADLRHRKCAPRMAEFGLR